MDEPINPAYSLSPLNKKEQKDAKKSRVGRIVKCSISAAILLALVILALWYFVFYNFRAGHVNNIRLGSDKARVERVLGEADAEEDFIWEYYGKNYLRLNQKIEDKTVELFNAVGMEEIETLTEELAALSEELFNLEYKYICVTFDGEDRVCEVVYDAARCDGALLSPKWKQPQDDDSFFSKLWAALKSGIGAGERIEIAELPAFYDLSQSRLSAQVYYADGSYRCTYLSAETLAGLNTYEAGEHTLSWQDGWGNYTATVTVSDKVEKGTTIAGTTEGGAQYTLTALDKGTLDELPAFSLALSGEGAVLSGEGGLAWAKYDLGKAVTNLSVGEGVTEIGKNAFSSFRALQTIDQQSPALRLENGVLYGNDGARVIVACAAAGDAYAMPDAVSEIDEAAFASAVLRSITTGTGLTTLPVRAFAHCYALESVQLSAALQTIEAGAFARCTALQTLHIPAGVTDISPFAFSGEFDYSDLYAVSSSTPAQNALTEITVDPANPAYSSEDGVLFNKGKTELLHFPQKKAGPYAVPDGVYRIGKAAFYGCELQTVTLPDGLYFIDAYAFAHSKIASVDLPQNLASIGSFAFAYCMDMKSIVIPPAVYKMGAGVFFANLIEYEDVSGYEDAVMTGKARSALEGIYCLADEAPKGSRMVILPDGSRQMIAADWPEDIRNGRKTWKSGTAAAVYWGGEWDYVNGVPTAK